MLNILNSLFTSTPQPPQISADQLKQALDDTDGAILIDVRNPIELTRGKIPGCVNIPLDELTESIERMVPKKDQKVYLYCLSGTRSDKAARIMREKGYEDVCSLTSGLLMWRYKKYPIE